MVDIYEFLTFWREKFNDPVRSEVPMGRDPEEFSEYIDSGGEEEDAPSEAFTAAHQSKEQAVRETENAIKTYTAGTALQPYQERAFLEAWLPPSQEEAQRELPKISTAMSEAKAAQQAFIEAKAGLIADLARIIALAAGSSEHEAALSQFRSKGMEAFFEKSERAEVAAGEAEAARQWLSRLLS